MNKNKLSLAFSVILVTLNACSLPGVSEPIDESATQIVIALSMSAVPTSTHTPMPSPSPVSLSIPTATEMSIVTSVPIAHVLSAALCWAGPGPAYEVISALKKNEPVVLLGRGRTDGWWIVENPIYHDPCWVMADELRLDPTTDVSALQVFDPPPTPTASFTPLPSVPATSTPTLTSTP